MTFLRSYWRWETDMTDIADAIPAAGELGKTGDEIHRRLQALESHFKTANKAEATLYELDAKYGLARLEAQLSAGKLLVIVAGIALTMSVGGDSIARLLRPKSPGLYERLALFSSENSPASASVYIDECVRELTQLRRTVAPLGAKASETQASGVKPTSTALAAPLQTESGSPAPASGQAAMLKLPRGVIAKLRDACGHIVGE